MLGFGVIYKRNLTVKTQIHFSIISSITLYRFVKVDEVIFYSVYIVVDSKASPSSQSSVNRFLYMISLVVRFKIEHLHDAVIWEVTFISKESLDQYLHALESRRGFQKIDRCS